MIFVRQRMNKPNRYRANLLHNRAHTHNILDISNSKATISYNNQDINDTFKIFFKQLYALQFNKQSLSPMEANISLVPKKGKAPKECSSYRLISVLNLDMKLLAKVLAQRLEKILPNIVTNDQTGFIGERYFSHNVRRLFSTPQCIALRLWLFLLTQTRH